MAVIYAQHKQADQLFALLEKKGITYNSRRKVNILDLPLIRNLRMFLEYLNLEYRRPFSGEHLLFKILHFAFLEISSSDLASLSLYMAKQHKKEVYWRQVIADPAMLKKAGVSNPEPLMRFAALNDTLQIALANESIPVFMEKIINRSGLLKYIVEHEDKLWLHAGIEHIFWIYPPGKYSPSEDDACIL